ncbi:2OG-Fe(II) oxygenase family protein [Kitasatospora sp. McL0602]|uniref:2OG-Fe(II) oxygenase family protein n=1 Tax=Kitasatospora sp. McL0602 TaxID=3439530 RepID=UPI003F8B7761
MTEPTASATVRAEVLLPPMPGESEAAVRYRTAELEIAGLVGDRLAFAHPGGFERALRQGFFQVRIPDGLDLAAGDRFAQQFFREPVGDQDDRYRGFRDVAVPGDYQGYFDREHDQWENFYVERGNWALLPDDVSAVGAAMVDLGIGILRGVLTELGISPADWAEITGGLTEQAGHQMLAFNHFRAEKQVRGSKFHRDSGWVTVLRSTEPGLLALIEGELCAIHPAPGCLVVNFGSSIEVLTAQLPTPVRASVHGVVRTERAAGRPDRWSYVTFLDSSLSGTIYRWLDGRPHALQSVAEFAVQEVSRTYDGDNATL